MSKIIKFCSIRTIPDYNIELLVVFLDNGRSFYCLVPCNIVINDDNVRQYKVSRTLYEHFLYIDFK